jgi:hypothetical protein
MAILSPFKLPFLSSLNMSLEKTSKPKIKRKGERGSPCLNPLLGEKKSKGTPIQKDKEGSRGDVNSNPRDPNMTES